ncbi:MAG TPA: CHC2 zinc finger domain-containing protein [Chitinophagaceae bacterium]|nr:CHC2 zinc finger domain-containing protein [Chitinophagaceae bacterium]
MSIGKKSFTCAQVNQMDIVDYLSSLGYHPARIKNADYWYLSPLRDEKTASFKVNRTKNAWYDHGIGKGGNMVDFGLEFHHCTVSALLEKFNGDFSFHQQPVKMIAAQKELSEQQINILSEQELCSLPLLRYIKQRRIAENIARKYCREVLFEMNAKKYSAIGFKNNEGGFELRNQWFKGSCSPKAVTTFTNDANNVSVFEGFFNFLSHQTIYQNQPPASSDFLILNSAAFFEKSKPFMEQYHTIRLYMDRDKTGQNCSQHAMASSKKYSDESILYDGYNDLNQWMQEIGKSQKQGLRRSLK